MQPAVTVSIPQAPAINEAKGSGLLLWVIAALSLAGMIVSGVSLQRHYAKSATTFCEFNEKFNCDIVNRSEYASIMGIPVAGIGVVGYALLFALSTFQRRRTETPGRLVLAAGLGLLFALYLTYIEGYVLQTWCILCLSSLGLITAIMLAAALLKFRFATEGI
jgi:vitamin-K-epoxide reductase (warfarin-sensitive)